MKKANVQDLLMKGYEMLKGEGMDTYMLDCQLLMAKVLNKDRLFVVLNRNLELDEQEVLEYVKYVEMRKNNMPVKYILGECEFMGLNFIVKPGVLIPRPDTEILVEAAIETIKRHQFASVCDVCCGSGAIGLSVASHVENVNVECYDISNTACEVTMENINKLNLQHKVSVMKSDLLGYAMDAGRHFQVVVSNPPYIRTEEIPELMSDVKDYEPYEALDGGLDGLFFYRKITLQSKKVLWPGGILAFEIGDTQKQEVADMMEAAGFVDVECLKDLAGRDRVVMGSLKSP